MGRFKHLVDSPASMEGIRTKYHILQGVALQYWSPNQKVTDRNEGEVVIPMFAFIEGKMITPGALYRRWNWVGVIPLEFQGEMPAVGSTSHRRIWGTERHLKHLMRRCGL